MFELNTQHDQLKFELSHYNSFVVLVFIAPRDAFTATSYKLSTQNTAEAHITPGVIYKFPTEVLDQLDSYDPATGYVLINDISFYKRTSSQPLYNNATPICSDFITAHQQSCEKLCFQSRLSVYRGLEVQCDHYP